MRKVLIVAMAIVVLFSGVGELFSLKGIVQLKDDGAEYIGEYDAKGVFAKREGVVS